MKGKEKTGSHPHIGIAAVASGLMALGLSAGLVALRLMTHLDGMFSMIFIPAGIPAPVLSLNPLALWAVSGVLAFALPAVIVNIPTMWRRSLIWFATVILTLAWGPVLMLASHKPEIGVAIVAVLWSGFCAMFYAFSHTLPVDKISSDLTKPNDGSR